jgi:uncharacterized protein DUF4375
MDVESAAGQHQSVSATMNESEAEWEARKRASEIADRVLRAQFDHGFANLSRNDRRFYCVYKVELEVRNGGLYQLMVNTAPEALREMPRALRAINAPKTAEIVERSYSVLFSKLPDTREQHEAALARVNDEKLGQLEPLDDAFYRTDEQLCSLLLETLTLGEENDRAV